MEDFLHQYASYKLMTQGMRGGNVGGGANAFYFGIGETYYT